MAVPANFSLPEFPYSQVDQFEGTSDETREYNCIAWAANDNSRWYEPDPFGIYFWPIGLARRYDVQTLIDLFQNLGYKKCSNPNFELGFEKVAIYEKNGVGTHAARQLEDGKWTSKLGRSYDVSHTLRTLDLGNYGKVTQFMKRAKVWNR